MDIWSPKEISTKILRGVTTRQITDLAEKEIIQPVKDSPGRGVPRFYDLQGVLDIAVACALRSLLPPYLVKEIMKLFRDSLKKADKGEIDEWDLLIIKRSERGRTVGTAVVSFETLDGQFLRWSDEEEKPTRRVYRSRKERNHGERSQIIQVVPCDWDGKTTKEEVKGGGVCDPLDHRSIILNITDLRREILAAIGEV
jgi:hypothetical protein